jgi:hypothetical protein
MITVLNLDYSITCPFEQFEALIAQFEAIDEALDEKLDQHGTPEEIDAHELLSELTNEYHDGVSNWGWMNDQSHIFIQSGSHITLVIEHDLTENELILKAWYTDNWEDLENL